MRNKKCSSCDRQQEDPKGEFLIVDHYHLIKCDICGSKAYCCQECIGKKPIYCTSCKRNEKISNVINKLIR